PTRKRNFSCAEQGRANITRKASRAIARGITVPLCSIDMATISSQHFNLAIYRIAVSPTRHSAARDRLRLTTRWRSDSVNARSNGLLKNLFGVFRQARDERSKSCE